MIQRRRESGQGLIEYALAVLLVLGLFLTMNSQIKRGISKLWKAMAKDIAAGCPGCEPPDTMR
jgi:hypothetical protein